MSFTMKPSEIRSAFMGYWNTNYSETPTQWPNINFPEENKKDVFVCFDITHTGGRTVLKGTGNQTRYSGVLFIDVKVPMMSGTKRAHEIADIVVDLLARQRITYNGKDVVTDAPELHRDGENDEYYVIPISVPFKTT